MNTKILVLLFLVAALALVTAKGKSKARKPCAPGSKNPECDKHGGGKNTGPIAYTCKERGGTCDKRCNLDIIYPHATDCNMKKHKKQCCGGLEIQGESDEDEED